MARTSAELGDWSQRSEAVVMLWFEIAEVGACVHGSLQTRSSLLDSDSVGDAGCG